MTLWIAFLSENLPKLSLSLSYLLFCVFLEDVYGVTKVLFEWKIRLPLYFVWAELQKAELKEMIIIISKVKIGRGVIIASITIIRLGLQGL